MSAPRNIQIVWTRAARIRHALNQDLMVDKWDAEKKNEEILWNEVVMKLFILEVQIEFFEIDCLFISSTWLHE